RPATPAGVRGVLPVALAPLFPAGKYALVVGRIDETAASKSKVPIDIERELVPQSHGDDRERQFAPVAVLLAAPTPVSARLFTGDVALLEERHREAALRQVIGGRRAEDAAADDDDIGLGRETLIAV